MGSLPATRLPDSGSTAESLCSEARRELTQPPQSVTLRLRPTAAGDTALTPTNQKGGLWWLQGVISAQSQRRARCRVGV